MNIKTVRNRLVVAVAIGAILSAPIATSFPGTIACSAAPELTASGNMAQSDFSRGPRTITERKLVTDPQARSAKSQKVALCSSVQCCSQGMEPGSRQADIVSGIESCTCPTRARHGYLSVSRPRCSQWNHG